MTSIDFPFRLTGGKINLISGREAVEQAVFTITKVLPGELPLSRDYGLFIDYNVPLEILSATSGEVKDVIESWYPTIAVDGVEFAPSQDGTEVRLEVRVREKNG